MFEVESAEKLTPPNYSQVSYAWGVRKDATHWKEKGITLTTGKQLSEPRETYSALVREAKKEPRNSKM